MPPSDAKGQTDPKEDTLDVRPDFGEVNEEKESAQAQQEEESKGAGAKAPAEDTSTPVGLPAKVTIGEKADDKSNAQYKAEMEQKIADASLNLTELAIECKEVPEAAFPGDAIIAAVERGSTTLKRLKIEKLELKAANFEPTDAWLARLFTAIKGKAYALQIIDVGFEKVNECPQAVAALKELLLAMPNGS